MREVITLRQILNSCYPNGHRLVSEKKILTLQSPVKNNFKVFYKNSL